MKANSYQKDNNVSTNDLLFGSDAEDSKKSKNYKIGDILALAPQGNTGAQGPAGPQGQNGLSAYEIAVNNGFEGTEEEWIASLQGSSAGINYKVLSISIGQIDTASPYFYIRENTFNEGFTTSRQSSGRYTLSSNGLEITDNYLVFITSGISDTKIMAASKAGGTIAIRSIEIATGNYVDNFSNVSFELRVYPTP